MSLPPYQRLRPPLGLLWAAVAAVWAPLCLSVWRHHTGEAVSVAEPKIGQQSLVEHCGDCHLDGAAKGGFAMDALLQEDAGKASNKELWAEVRNYLRLELMPPPQQNLLARSHRVDLVRWVEDQQLAPPHLPLAASSAQPRRLNRREYNRTIQDLLGISLAPADRFPEDESAMGFDNIAAVQHLPPSLVEGYLTAAETSLAAAFDPILPSKKHFSLLGTSFPAGSSLSYENNLVVASSEPVTTLLATNHGGEGPARYQLKLTAYARKAGDALPELRINDTLVALQGSRKNPDLWEGEVMLAEGEAPLRLSLANPYSNPEDEDPLNRFRQAVVCSIDLNGPLGLKGTPTPQAQQWLADVSKTGDEQTVLSTVLKFANAAVRRPLEPALQNTLNGLCSKALQDGMSPLEAVRLGMTAALVSPAFLFFTEPSSLETAGTAAQVIDEHSLAVRLSYFLWKAPPDQSLRRLAEQGQLRANLRQTVDRMLQDPRSGSLAEDFAGQWLHLRNVTLSRPDPVLFPDGSSQLLADMQTEVELFVMDLIQRRRPVREFLLAETTTVNAALARHYSMATPIPTGEKSWETVSLKGTFRKGLLGKAGVLTLTSQPTRTSPVVRGKWVLECLLGMSPPPPPPNVPTLETPATGELHGSQRQLLEAHRTQPACVNCHACLDPFGFALEKYDPLGRWRFHDAGSPLDAVAALPSGKSIRGADELSDWLAHNHLDDFRLHLAQSMLTYGTGQPCTLADLRQAREVQRIAGKHGDSFAGYVWGVVRSVLFQTRATGSR